MNTTTVPTELLKELLLAARARGATDDQEDIYDHPDGGSARLCCWATYRHWGTKDNPHHRECGAVRLSKALAEFDAALNHEG